MSCLFQICNRVKLDFNCGEITTIESIFSLSRPRSGQIWVAGGKPARRAVRNPRWGNASSTQRPVGAQQVCCSGAGCTPTGYGLGMDICNRGLHPRLPRYDREAVGKNANYTEFDTIKNINFK
jgi:hypothetical protein